MIALRGRAAQRNRAPRGQAVVEFAMVAGLFMLLVGGIVQFGVILWSQNAVTEIARDTARWAVTQKASPCDSPAQRSLVADAADELAQAASLVGYAAGTWSTAAPIASMPEGGVGVDWSVPDGYYESDCPPSDNQVVATVRVRVSHAVPIFIPGLQIVAPTCSGTSFCVSSMTELRMEPKSP